MLWVLWHDGDRARLSQCRSWIYVLPLAQISGVTRDKSPHHSVPLNSPLRREGAKQGPDCIVEGVSSLEVPKAKRKQVESGPKSNHR